MNKIKVLIADDHPLMRNGIKSVLLADSELEIIGEAKDGEEAYKLILDNQPDVALLDVEMPKMTGLEIARRMKSDKINIKIIFLTMYKEEEMFNEAMDVGAFGYVLKENAVEDILESVKTVAGSKYYISPMISNYLVKRLNEQMNFSSSHPSINDLTKSERAILKLISQEKTTHQIAEELHISYKTAENHRNNISKKLNLSGSHSLVKFAIKNRSLL